MEKKGGETPGSIVPSMVSTLLGLNTSVRSGLERNEAVEQQASDEGLPSYEAALKLDANGYVWHAPDPREFFTIVFLSVVFLSTESEMKNEGTRQRKMEERKGIGN